MEWGASYRVASMAEASNSISRPRPPVCDAPAGVVAWTTLQRRPMHELVVAVPGVRYGSALLIAARKSTRKKPPPLPSRRPAASECRQTVLVVDDDAANLALA